VFDFDGVFTDGKIYVLTSGEEMKCYNGKDSYGLILLRNRGIKTGLITRDTSDIVSNTRHIHSRMDMISTSCLNKIEILNNWREKLGLEWHNVAYIGDDVPDIDCLDKVGFSGCPNDAIPEVKNIVDFVCKRKGGEGAVREFINRIIFWEL